MLPSDGATGHSVLAVPLSVKQELVAVLALYRNKKDAFTRVELNLLSVVAPIIAPILHNTLLYREVESRANLDALTGVYIRSQFLRLLDEELARARRNEQPVALVIAELPDDAEFSGSAGHSENE